jgi:hypothetical protein
MSYNKIYYLVLLIIIGLVVWLVTDFIQNKLQADNALFGISQPNSADKSVMVFPPPILPQKDWGVMWGAKTEETKVPLATTALKPNYILTGTLIEPTSARAFILIPSKNDEKSYKIGDKIEEWEVVGITPDEVKLKNSQSGAIIDIPMQKQWTNPTTAPKQFNDAFKNITNQVNIPGISPEVMNNILSGNEPREKVEAYLQSAVASLPPVYVKELITKFTDIPNEDMPADDKLGDYAKKLFGIFEGQSPGVADNGESILFTTSVNADNSPISPTISFKAGDRQIYACFSNQGPLNGLSKLVHRWTNKSTGEIIKLETRPIDPNAPFNFIWVRKTDGWQVGDYSVELFKTQTLEKIASGNFTIIP